LRKDGESEVIRVCVSPLSLPVPSQSKRRSCTGTRPVSNENCSMAANPHWWKSVRFLWQTRVVKRNVSAKSACFMYHIPSNHIRSPIRLKESADYWRISRVIDSEIMICPGEPDDRKIVCLRLCRFVIPEIQKIRKKVLYLHLYGLFGFRILSWLIG
jgi:hypothetical protein